MSSSDLRKDIAGVLRRVSSGEDVVITVGGRPVVRLIPLEHTRRRWLDRAELVRRIEMARADPELRDDLERLAGESTDDVDST